MCLIGTILRLPLLGYEAWLLATEVTFSELTVLALLTAHIPFLAWVADLIRVIFGAEFGDVILGLPAIIVTIVKLIFGTLVGFWALDAVHDMDSSYASGDAGQSTG